MNGRVERRELASPGRARRPIREKARSTAAEAGPAPIGREPISMAHDRTARALGREAPVCGESASAALRSLA